MPSAMQLILQRELRREARRSRAGAVRLVCSVIVFLAALFLLFSTSGGGRDGRTVFNVLTFIGFAFCFIAGIRVAAGTIAEEKRDGTLPPVIPDGAAARRNNRGQVFCGSGSFNSASSRFHPCTHDHCVAWRRHWRRSLSRDRRDRQQLDPFHCHRLMCLLVQSAERTCRSYHILFARDSFGPSSPSCAWEFLLPAFFQRMDGFSVDQRRTLPPISV